MALETVLMGSSSQIYKTKWLRLPSSILDNWSPRMFANSPWKLRENVNWHRTLLYRRKINIIRRTFLKIHPCCIPLSLRLLSGAKRQMFRFYDLMRLIRSQIPHCLLIGGELISRAEKNTRRFSPCANPLNFHWLLADVNIFLPLHLSW